MSKSAREAPSLPVFGHGTVPAIPSQVGIVGAGAAGRKMFDKQLANAVKHGRKVTFTLRSSAVGPLPQLSGYLAGADDEAYFLLQPTEEHVKNHLVPRDSVLYLTIDHLVLVDAESRKEELNQIIDPYRKRILETFFGQARS